MMENNQDILIEAVPASIDEIGEQEARDYQRLLTHFLHSYRNKGEETTDE